MLFLDFVFLFILTGMEHPNQVNSQCMSWLCDFGALGRLLGMEIPQLVSRLQVSFGIVIDLGLRNVG